MNGGGVMLALLLTRTMPTPDARETMPARVQEVLQYLASVAPSREERARAYRLHKPIDPSVFFGYLPSTGLSFSDVTGGAPGRVGLDQLRKEIKAERGLIYRYLVGLAIDASCCRDHPKISSEKKSGVVSVALPNYTLEFGVENGLLKLRVIECTDPGGD